MLSAPYRVARITGKNTVDDNNGFNNNYIVLIKMSGETPEVRSDKKETKREKERTREKKKREKERKRKEIRKKGEKGRKGEKKREEDRRREIKERNIEKKGEEKRENERKEEKKMSRVNYYQYALNSRKEKLNILAEMLKISKSGCGSIYNRPPSLSCWS